MGLERAQRTHFKTGSNLFNYLKANGRDFKVERTKTGATTYHVGTKSFYIREKQVSRGFVNRILNFQRSVAKGKIFTYLNRNSINQLEAETQEIKNSILYKGFCFEPDTDKDIRAVKVDFDSAYWRTAYLMKHITLKQFRAVERSIIKLNRLRLVGTLGKSSTVTDYVKGMKDSSYPQKLKKRRIVYQNIYERIKKFVDELMVLCYLHNPDNFLGFYVDGFWLKEPDEKLMKKLKTLYKLKIKDVQLNLTKNKHGFYYIHEADVETGEVLPYDAQFKKDFANYSFLHTFEKNKIYKPKFIKRWKQM